MMLLLESSTALWRKVFQRELLQRYSDFCGEWNFSESKLSGVCSGGVWKYEEQARKLFFGYGSILFVGVDQLLCLRLLCTFYFPHSKI
jgi:hypothetical protein